MSTNTEPSIFYLVGFDRCLREYLSWTIKQTPKKSLEKDPANVKSVLKRMFSYALHPAPFKRLGAALAFNSIYSVLREEDSLVDRFTFWIMVRSQEENGYGALISDSI
jgi:DNA-dependent protein kinase catalytic subunit